MVKVTQNPALLIALLGDKPELAGVVAEVSLVRPAALCCCCGLHIVAPAGRRPPLIPASSVCRKRWRSGSWGKMAQAVATPRCKRERRFRRASIHSLKPTLKRRRNIFVYWRAQAQKMPLTAVVAARCGAKATANDLALSLFLFFLPLLPKPQLSHLCLNAADAGGRICAQRAPRRHGVAGRSCRPRREQSHARGPLGVPAGGDSRGLPGILWRT